MEARSELPQASHDYGRRRVPPHRPRRVRPAGSARAGSVLPVREVGRTSPTFCSASRKPHRSPLATPTSSSAATRTRHAVTDDWRLSPSFTMNIGVRWEYESPISERLDRLVNLDVAPDFTAAGQVVASAATGAVTGAGIRSRSCGRTSAGSSRALHVAWRPGRDRRWSSVPATASIATRTYISRLPTSWRSSLRCRRHLKSRIRSDSIDARRRAARRTAAG